MDLERDRPRRELERQPAAREPRVERLGPRNEPPPPPTPTAAEPPPSPSPGENPLWKWGRIAAILLLTIAGGVLIGGSDEKPGPPPSPPAANAETVADEIVVDLRDSVTDAEIAALGQSAGIELRYNSVHAVAAKLMVATINPVDRDRVLLALRASPLVEAAEPQFIYHIFQAPAPTGTTARFVPNDPEYRRQWHLREIGMEEAWTKSKGKGVTVAVIDSGVGAHASGGWIHGQDFNLTKFVKGYNFAENKDDSYDDNGHGTHVAGTIAESTDNGIFGAGVAPEAQIMPLRVGDAEGRIRGSAITDAIRYAADHGANVANLSLGGPTHSDVQQKALAYALRKGVTLVCATGNEGKEGVSYPAREKECIAVSSVGPGGLMAASSSWGKEVDLAGPGGDGKRGAAAMVWQNTFQQRQGLFGAWGPRIDGFYPLSGTSMATPHVAGVAALLVSLGMNDPKEIRSQLRKTARKYAPADHYGAGILDAARAVETVQRSQKTNWVQIGVAVGAALLLLTIGRNLRRKTDPMFFVHHVAIALAAGLFFPIVLEKFAGFGSLWNLAGHSVIVAILFLMTPKLERTGFWKAFAFTVGIVIHLLLDADSGRAPFQVYPQERILFWMYANAAVGLFFCASAFRTVRRRSLG